MNLSSLSNDSLNFLFDTYKGSFREKTPCKYPDCNEENSANNHIFSKSVLKSIVDAKNRAIFLSFDITRDYLGYRFIEAGWDQIRNYPISMRSLCQPHDHAVFKILDSDEGVDLSVESNARTAAYKAGLHEIYKCESWLRICQKIQSSEHDILKKLIDVDYKIPIYMDRIKSAYYMIKYINDFKDPFSVTFDYQQHVFKNKIEFYMCLYTRVPPRSRYPKLQQYMEYELPKNIFINFIPQNESSLLSIGAFGFLDRSMESIEIYLEELNSTLSFLTDDMRQLKYTSDLALMRSDTWCFSHDFYEDLIRPREREILEIKNFYSYLENANKPVGDFCLFWK